MLIESPRVRREQRLNFGSYFSVGNGRNEGGSRGRFHLQRLLHGALDALPKEPVQTRSGCAVRGESAILVLLK